MGKRDRFNSPFDTYFVTSVLYRRRPLFSDLQLADAFCQMMRFYESNGICKIDGYVVMPDHFHALITMKGNRSPGKFVGPLKSYFARTVRESGKKSVQLKMPSNGLFRIWEPRFWEKTIMTEKMFANCMEYIHWNPVRAGLVADPSEYRYSTARLFL